MTKNKYADQRGADECIIDGYSRGLGYREISRNLEKLGYLHSPCSVRNRVYILRQNGVQMLKPADMEMRTISGIDQLRENAKGLIKDHKLFGVVEDANKKILCLSDLHMPFENDVVIRDAMERHGDADTLVLNGDIMDLSIFSKFSQDSYSLWRSTYEHALEWMIYFAQKFSRIVLIAGNHDLRAKKYFERRVNPDVLPLVSSDILSLLANGYGFAPDGQMEKMYDFGNLFYEPGVINWYAKIGNAIFVHPSFYSSIPMRTAINADTYFSGFEQYDCLIVSHTHNSGRFVRNKKLLIEQGACCYPMEYAFSGRSHSRLWSFGYAVLHMDMDGNVDFNSTTSEYLGTGWPEKQIKIPVSEDDDYEL